MYQFNKKIVKHNFCPACGCSFVGSGMGLVAVNIRTVDDIDLGKIKTEPFDGKSMVL